MDPWPFEDEEWDNVTDLSRRLSSTWSYDGDVECDQVLHDSILQELIGYLGDLISKYGENPVLLETLADYVEDKHERLELYRKALKLSIEHDLTTLTIRIWLAELLLEEFADRDEARRVLKDGEDEFLDEEADATYQSMYADLWWRCRPLESNGD